MKHQRPKDKGTVAYNTADDMDIAITPYREIHTEERAKRGAQDSFEIAMRELEEIVTTLERGNIPLEQQITLVRRGMVLAEQCDATLSQAEATLEQLIATPDGELITQRIEYEDEQDQDQEDEDAVEDE